MSIPVPWILIVLAALFMMVRCDMNQTVERSRDVQPSNLDISPSHRIPTSPIHWPYTIHLASPTGHTS